MHTLAQPLTVLRATLEIASGNACSISHYQHAIDSSLAEIARVSEAMGFVQELVRIATTTSDTRPITILNLHSWPCLTADTLPAVIARSAAVNISPELALRESRPTGYQNHRDEFRFHFLSSLNHTGKGTRNTKGKYVKMNEM